MKGEILMTDENTKVFINGQEIEVLGFTISREGSRLIDECIIRIPGHQNVSQWSRVDIVQDKVPLHDVSTLISFNNSIINELNRTSNIGTSTGDNKTIGFVNGHFGIGANINNSKSITTFINTIKPFDISFWHYGTGGSIDNEQFEIGSYPKLNLGNRGDNRLSNVASYLDEESGGTLQYASINDIKPYQWSFIRIYYPQSSIDDNTHTIFFEINGQKYKFNTVDSYDVYHTEKSRMTIRDFMTTTNTDNPTQQIIDNTVPKLQNISYYGNDKTVELIFNKTVKEVDISKLTFKPNQTLPKSPQFPSNTNFVLTNYIIKNNKVLITIDEESDNRIENYGFISYDSSSKIPNQTDAQNSRALLFDIGTDAIKDYDGNSAVSSLNNGVIYRAYKVPIIFAKEDEREVYGSMIKNLRIREGSTYTDNEIQTIVKTIESSYFKKFGGRVQNIERNDNETILTCHSFGSEIGKTDTITTGTDSRPENIIEQAITQDTISLNFVNNYGISNVTLGYFKNRGKLVDNIKKLANVGGFNFTTDGNANFIIYGNKRRTFLMPLIHGQNGINVEYDIRNDQNFNNSLQGTIPITENTDNVTFHQRIIPYGNYRYNPTQNGDEIPTTINLNNTITQIKFIYTRWSTLGLYDWVNNTQFLIRKFGSNYLNSSQYSVSGTTLTINSSGKQKLMPDRIPVSTHADYIYLKVDLYVVYTTSSTDNTVDVRAISQRGFNNIHSSIGTPSYLTKTDMLTNIEKTLISTFNIKKSINVKLHGYMAPYLEGDIVCVVNDEMNINGNYIIKAVKYDYVNGITTITCNEYDFNEIDDRDLIVKTINELGNAIKEIDFIVPSISISGETVNLEETYTLVITPGDKIPALYDIGKYDQSRYGVGNPVRESTKAFYDDSQSTYDGTKTYS